MRTARSPTIRASVASHQISALGGCSSEQIWTVFHSKLPDVTSGDPALWGGVYSEVQCIIGNGHIMGLRLWTDTTENITFLQLCWRAVKRDKSRDITPDMQSSFHDCYGDALLLESLEKLWNVVILLKILWKCRESWKNSSFNPILHLFAFIVLQFSGRSTN